MDVFHFAFEAPIKIPKAFTHKIPYKKHTIHVESISKKEIEDCYYWATENLENGDLLKYIEAYKIPTPSNVINIDQLKKYIESTLVMAK